MGKYTLIVTEKPDAAIRIATALDTDGKPKKTLAYGVPYYQAYRNGEIVVVPALGHLYTVAAKGRASGYPVFDYQWVPLYQAERVGQGGFGCGLKLSVNLPWTLRGSWMPATSTSRAAS